MIFVQIRGIYAAKAFREHLMKKLEYDEVGYWSEVKLAIIREYAASYTQIMSAQKNPPFKYIYIDAFAGPGQHISRKTKKFIPGSPLNALNVEPQFKEELVTDDVLLMQFAFKWLKFSLFGEKTLQISSDSINTT